MLSPDAPMSLIDPRTVILLGGLMSGLMSLVLYALRRSYPASIRGLGEWSAALLLVFGGTALASGHGRLPDIVSISLARLLLASGLYLSYVGTQRFFDVRPRMLPWVALIGAVALVQLWFTFVAPSYHVRLALANVLAGFLFAMHAALVLRQGSPTFAKILAASVLALMAAIQLMRLVSSFIWPVGNDIFETAPQHLFYVASLVFCILLFSISTVLMATDRLRGRLEHLATHDSLTNALTRRHMDEACQQELERCRRHDRSMALLMMDLDHFKAINDTYGHQTGDQVLINFVARVNALLRRPDQLGRFGGEEFIALLPETSLEEALAVAGRIREACAVTSQGPSCTVSIGVTTNHTDTDTVEKMLGRADTAMYRAKDKGRNRVEAS
jgi:diguanylate cyclase (GGDEF)-like protein